MPIGTMQRAAQIASAATLMGMRPIKKLKNK
jgi:hypothetical protein